MTLTLVLFGIILLLLVVIVVMMVTGWPGLERAEIEKAGNAMRREMAEHRAESIQLLHAIRIEVEDSVRESIEREMVGFGSRGGRSRGSKVMSASKMTSRSSQQQGAVDKSRDLSEMDESVAFAEVPEEFLQLPLFPESSKPVEPAKVIDEPVFISMVPDKDPEPEPETISMGYIDDIPDVE